MTLTILHNDFLYPLLALPPVILGIVVWGWGWGSLFVVAIKAGAVRKLFKHPGFMIGDFFLLPIAAGLIAYFYHSVREPSPLVTSQMWTYLAVSLSLGLTLLSASKFSSFSVWWLPHLVFYWFMSYVVVMFLTKGIAQLIISVDNKALWLIWISVLIMMALHLLLGVVFGPKKLPAV